MQFGEGDKAVSVECYRLMQQHGCDPHAASCFNKSAFAAACIINAQRDIIFAILESIGAVNMTILIKEYSLMISILKNQEFTLFQQQVSCPFQWKINAKLSRSYTSGVHFKRK